MNGVKAVLEASAKSKVKRIVMTSSFASVMDVNRKGPPYFTFTGDDWNPLTYEEAAAPTTPAHIASATFYTFSINIELDILCDYISYSCLVV